MKSFLGKKVIKITKRSIYKINMKKILFISSSRADYGLLRNVILKQKKIKKVKVFNSCYGVSFE